MREHDHDDPKTSSDPHIAEEQERAALTGMLPAEELAYLQAQTRRHFLRNFTAGVGTMFLGASLPELCRSVHAADRSIDGNLRVDFVRDPSHPLSVLPPQFAPTAKRIIYLHMAGAPSQLELFDYKPDLAHLDGKDCPQSFLAGKRFAFITGVPKLLGPQYSFHRAGQSGQWISDRLPHLEKHVDDLCFIKSMKTDQFNHAPAQLLVQTGNARLRLRIHRVMGDLWFRNREPEPSWFYRSHLRWQHAGRRQAALGFRLSAQCLSGRTVPVPRRSCALFEESRRSLSTGSAQHARHCG